MRKRVTARFVNGVISALIVIVFLVHGTLGSAFAFTGFASPAAWLVWCGVGLIGVHVVASIVTSRQQLEDRERPPSVRKKRHLALKWATGVLLAVFATAHVFMPHWGIVGQAIVVALSVALAVHVCVGAKSLLKDLEIDRSYKLAFRIVVCAFAAGFAICALAAICLT